MAIAVHHSLQRILVCSRGKRTLPWLTCTTLKSYWRQPLPTPTPITSTISSGDYTFSSHRSYSSTATTSGKNSMTFEEYRKLRKSLKARARIAGIPMGLVGMGISSFISVQMNPRMFEMQPEEVQPILGMDPIVFAALCGVGSGIVGFMIGGALFTATWKVLFRKTAQQLQEMNDNFLKRIQDKRFTGNSKYEDDYYADKVLTLSDYRQWIRQQQRRKELAAEKQHKTE